MRNKYVDSVHTEYFIEMALTDVKNPEWTRYVVEIDSLELAQVQLAKVRANPAWVPYEFRAIERTVTTTIKVLEI